MNKSNKSNMELWRTALCDHRHKADMTYREIADKSLLSEKTIGRIFTGEAKSPSVDIVGRIISAMGTTWHDTFGESSAVITTVNVDALQAEIYSLKEQLRVMEAELVTTKIKLEYEQRINGIHEYYKQKENEQT